VLPVGTLALIVVVTSGALLVGEVASPPSPQGAEVEVDPTPSPQRAEAEVDSTPSPQRAEAEVDPPPTSLGADGDVASTGRLLFGLGPTADAAMASPLTQGAPVDLITTWFNRPEDLEWLSGWRDNLIPQVYAEGKAHHLIVFNEGSSGVTETPYGPACGLLYPISDRFDDDMRDLAALFGRGPLFVTMFSEFQTYPCQHNQWEGAEAYYRALQDRYLAAVEIFHSANPLARVGLGWGGWQARWDDPSVGGGRSLIPRFADVMERSDYVAFQAMQTDGNAEDILEMTRLLRPYGPVLLAHYLPDDESEAVWDEDTSRIFTDDYIDEVTEAGLFGFAFMDPLLLDEDPARMQRAITAVRRYGMDAVVVDHERGDPRPEGSTSTGDDG
jgi:hypothetical protein